MKKILLLIMALGVLTVSCKKNNTDDGGDEQEQTYECLPKQLDYTDHNDPNENESTVYAYDGNAIKFKDRTFADGTTYRYNYIYSDKSKGLLDRIDIIIDGDVVAKIVYTVQNDLITKRELLVALQGGGFASAWEVLYNYDNNNKVSTIQIKDYDLWNNGQNPTDETGVYTYTGDNVTNLKFYDTADMNTVKEEFTYEYDQGKRTFDNVVTQTYPTVRVNNVTRTIHQIYGNNPSTEETITTITYNNKGFPEEFAVEDDRGNPLNTQTVTYENCN